MANFVDFAGSVINIDRVLTVTDTPVDGVPHVTFTMDAGSPYVLPGTRLLALQKMNVAGRRRR